MILLAKVQLTIKLYLEKLPVTLGEFLPPTDF